VEREVRTLAGLTVCIDRLLCVGFEDCIDAERRLFRLDEEGIATFDVDADRATAEQIVEACRACPVDAFQVTDAQGRRVVP